MSHSAQEWHLHRHRCGNPKSRVNPVFAGRELQREESVRHAERGTDGLEGHVGGSTFRL